MPVLDGDFEAFVTNLGKYNEGMLVGEWGKFPTVSAASAASVARGSSQRCLARANLEWWTVMICLAPM